MDEETPFVRFDGVSKRYGSSFGLVDASFEVRTGEVFGIIGPNGAGKTTLLKLMVGLRKPSSGTLTINGRVMPAERKHVHRLLGYLSQHTAFQSWRTVEHALSTMGKLSGMGGEGLSDNIQRVLDLVGLQSHRTERISTLSGGLERRLGLAQALLTAPRLLVLDEPLAGLDPPARRVVLDIIRELRDEAGVTVVFSSHILADVEDLVDRVAFLHEGHIGRVDRVDKLKREFRRREVHLVLAEVMKDPPELEDITDWSVEGNEVTVTLSEVGTIDAVVAAVVSAGGKVRSVKGHDPSLVDVFDHLVGWA